MLRLYNVRFGGMLLLVLGFWSVAAHAEQLQKQERVPYQYVSLNQFVPPGFSPFFDAVAINNSGRVYGNVYDDSEFPSHIAVYANGVMRILHSGSALVANNWGTVGGSFFDPVTLQDRAALFHGNHMKLVPTQQGEISSYVIALNDWGTALVSFSNSESTSYSLYSRGQLLPLYLEAQFTPEFINNQGIIAGTTSGNHSGFRLNPFTGENTLLNPISPDPSAWVQGINNRGNVLGYSYVNSAIERIGVWDGNGVFKTYFVEGIPEYPTISNSLLFNEKNLIVITNVTRPSTEIGNSYLVPKPGVRLNLAHLVDGIPEGNQLDIISDINKQGSMIGLSFNTFDFFLLERIKSKHH